MRVTAARLAKHGQDLRIEDVDLPEPGDGEVVMDVAYSGVNRVDMYAAQGKVTPDAPVPRTLGTEGAGTVDGRPVMVRGHGIGTARDGVWATGAVVPRAAVIEVPEEVALEAAAAMGVAGVTAWRAVTELARVGADDTALVLGASGGVGSIVVSVAHAVGATVIGQTGHEGNSGWIKDRGADQVIVADAARLADAAASQRPTVVSAAQGSRQARAGHGRQLADAARCSARCGAVHNAWTVTPFGGPPWTRSCCLRTA